MASTERGTLAEFIHRSLVVEPDSLGMLADLAGEVLGARSGRLFVVDYAMRCVRELREDGLAKVLAGMTDPAEIMRVVFTAGY